jgi:ferredoxin
MYGTTTSNADFASNLTIINRLITINSNNEVEAQILVNMATDYSSKEQYKIQPEKSVVIDMGSKKTNRERSTNLKIHDKEVPIVNTHMLLHSIIRLQSLHPVHQCGLGCVRCNTCVGRVLKTFARKSPTCPNGERSTNLKIHDKEVPIVNTTTHLGIQRSSTVKDTTTHLLT